MNRLKLTKYRFTLQFDKQSTLPPFVGNTLRGALGRVLFDHYREAYDRVFKVKREVSAPNPFVIATQYPGRGFYRAGDTLEFSVALFGSACGYESDIAAAAGLMTAGKLAGARLISAEREYAREWSDSGADCIDRVDKLRVEFLTPTEFLSSKEPVFNIDFATFIDSLFGRICDIIGAYADGEFVIPYALVARRPFITAECDLAPVAFCTSVLKPGRPSGGAYIANAALTDAASRAGDDVADGGSSRKRSGRPGHPGQPVYGVMGGVTFFGDLTRFLPYIDLGSQLHIGKKTTRSCGQYILVTYG